MLALIRRCINYLVFYHTPENSSKNIFLCNENKQVVQAPLSDYNTRCLCLSFYPSCLIFYKERKQSDCRNCEVEKPLSRHKTRKWGRTIWLFNIHAAHFQKKNKCWQLNTDSIIKDSIQMGSVTNHVTGICAFLLCLLNARQNRNIAEGRECVILVNSQSSETPFCFFSNRYMA